MISDFNAETNTTLEFNLEGQEPTKRIQFESPRGDGDTGSFKSIHSAQRSPCTDDKKERDVLNNASSGSKSKRPPSFPSLKLNKIINDFDGKLQQHVVECNQQNQHHLNSLYLLCQDTSQDLESLKKEMGKNSQSKAVEEESFKKKIEGWIASLEGEIKEIRQQIRTLTEYCSSNHDNLEQKINSSIVRLEQDLKNEVTKQKQHEQHQQQQANISKILDEKKILFNSINKPNLDSNMINNIQMEVEHQQQVAEQTKLSKAGSKNDKEFLGEQKPSALNTEVMKKNVNPFDDTQNIRINAKIKPRK